MPVNFDELHIGYQYDRPYLARLWSYRGIQGLNKGVITPSDSRFIVLFVTKKKQNSLQQYNDYIDDGLLFWEGEDKHRSDHRIRDTRETGDEIHLFYRDTHHTQFIYLGPIYLLEYLENKTKPSEFIFQIGNQPQSPDVIDDLKSHSLDFQSINVTERQSLEKSRIGQGLFRENLIKLWGSCSITGLTNLSLVRASHIKPWRDSTNSERLNPYNGLLLIPNYDILFDRGLIAFRENGEIILSGKLSKDDKQIFHVEDYQRLRTIWPENKEYLEYHRDKVLRL